MTTLAWRAIGRSFGDTEVLRGFELAVANGEIVSILGPSGCGKTTALRIAAGLDSADEGQVLIGDVDVTEWAPKRREMGMVFQHDGLLPHLDVAANIGLSLRSRRVDRGEINAQVSAVADIVGCRHLLDRRPQRLSGGERQRVALARALVRRPEVLLLDEPLSSLDLEARTDLRSVVVRAVRALGTTAVFVTHDHDEAAEVGDRLAVMSAGSIAQVDTPEALYWNPATATMALVAGSRSMNLVPLNHAGSGWRFGPFCASVEAIPLWGRAGTPQARGAAASTIGFRPEHVEMSAPSSGGVAATVSHARHVGGGQFVTVDHRTGTTMVRTSSAGRWVVGDRVSLRVDSSLLYGFDTNGMCVGSPDRSH